ncbi:MAG: TetR/AcrR family transcriptional regulator [Dehalococcoidia bacterium]
METTKDRILDATAELFRRYGYTGTGMKQIVAQAQAPFGSIYHFFPGGKEQLGQDVIRRSGRMYQDLFTTIVGSAPDVLTGVQNLFSGAAEVLRQSDYADACPIATVALEVASTNEPLREATANVFEDWIAAGTERFATAGVAETRARELAILLIATLEGAFILCRATRTTEAMDVASAATLESLRSAMPTTATAA